MMEIKDIYGNLPRLETERLILRKVTLGDADAMFAYASNDDVTRYVTWNTHQSVEESRGYIAMTVQNYEEGKIAPWAIEFKENGEMIGTVDFVGWRPEHQWAELGYVLNPAYWGRGIVPEAVGELMRLGFEEMELVRIQARCFQENEASERVMQKLGMTYEGTLRKMLNFKGRHWDLKMYSILKEEYERWSAERK